MGSFFFFYRSRLERIESLVKIKGESAGSIFYLSVELVYGGKEV